MKWLRCAMASAMGKIMSRVLPSCMTSPLTRMRRPTFWGSAISSGVTSQGPTGPKVSQLLPLVNWPERCSWKSRSDTSLTATKPAT